MRDYSLNLEDSKTFVLNYTIKGNQIIVNLAKGENFIIPYTQENEKKLLEIMKKQVLNSNRFMKTQEKRFSRSWKLTTLSVFMLMFNVLVLASGKSILPVGSGLCASLFVFNIIYSVYCMVDSKKNIKDIQKNVILLCNEKKLNEKVRGNPHVLATTDEKLKEMVSSTPTELPVFTLNNADEIEYRQLEKILEIIDREEKLGFDYSSASDDNPLVLKRKLK